MLVDTVAMQMILGITFALTLYKTRFLYGAVRLIMMFSMGISGYHICSADQKRGNSKSQPEAAASGWGFSCFS